MLDHAIPRILGLVLALLLPACPRPSEPKGPDDDPGPADGETGKQESKSSDTGTP